MAARSGWEPECPTLSTRPRGVPQADRGLTCGYGPRSQVPLPSVCSRRNAPQTSSIGVCDGKRLTGLWPWGSQNAQPQALWGMENSSIISLLRILSLGMAGWMDAIASARLTALRTRPAPKPAIEALPSNGVLEAAWRGGFFPEVGGIVGIRFLRFSGPAPGGWTNERSRLRVRRKKGSRPWDGSLDQAVLMAASAAAPHSAAVSVAAAVLSDWGRPTLS
jgi:hypothetical protein